MANINIDQLASEISKSLKDFSQDVVEMVDISSEKIGKEAVKQRKTTSPKESGGYGKAWTVKTEGTFGQPKNRIVHVRKPHYRLTHLLEYGHALKGGGRTEAQPHIKPAEDMVIQEFQREVREAIERG